MKRAKPFATKLSIANVDQIIDVSRPNPKGPVQMSLEQEEPSAA